MKPFKGDYFCSLNSADKYDPELPLVKSKAHGGTLALWKAEHDPFVSIHPVSSTAFLPIIFNPPSSPLSIHICVYLPTLGKERTFYEELSNLSSCLDEIDDLYPNAPCYIRGDFNVSRKNVTRTEMLNFLTNEHQLNQVQIPHATYHHFLGNGLSDSHLDRILFSTSLMYPEVLETVHCKHEHPLVDSHHDIILTKWKLPNVTPLEPSKENIVAPRIEIIREKILWDDAGIEKYQLLVTPHLSRLQDLWLVSPSKTSISLLLESTNNILTKSASSSNKTVDLSKPRAAASSKTPLHIRISKNKLLKMNRELKQVVTLSPNISEKIINFKTEYNQARCNHRKLLRMDKANAALERDELLFSNPIAVQKKIRASKRCKAGKIQKLSVGNKTYIGDSVQDGFFDSISKLKTRDESSLNLSEHFADFSSDYLHILELCKAGQKIPSITETQSFKLLQKLKPNVNDFFGVTPNHYNYAGPLGWKHFHLLLSSLLHDVNNTTIHEINVVHAIILFKGHNKDKSSDRSYRTISTCPVIAKALDLYIRDLFIDDWNRNQAETQFQGEGSSHELAALLLTEVILHSLYTLKMPLYVIYLDAKSAFDVVLKELIIKNLFHCNTSGHSLLYLNNRLENRETFIEWDGQVMGPIYDQRSLEQGGPSSSDLYKIFGKEQLETSQASELGVKLGNKTISGIGLADDTLHVSNNIHNLFYLLHLTLLLCSKYQVQLCSEKTKLQAFATKDMNFAVDYAKHINPIKVNNEKIEFVESAEHVGMLRSTSGNHQTILERFKAHRQAIASVLHVGVARGHRGNPAASFKVHQLYGTPVLMSGLAPLLLSKQEVGIIEHHYKETIRSIQRLFSCTPSSVTYFLAGSLPGIALLHQRQLSIFGMISRLPTKNILNEIAINYFSYKTICSKSWFSQIRELCLCYNLPHPLTILASPPSKEMFKRMVKSSLISHWEVKLRTDAAALPSLMFFKPAFMSLTSPHPLWSTAGSSPSKVAMATIQAQMISGRYRSQQLCSHWSPQTSGFCVLSEACSSSLEDIPHILSSCCALANIREKLLRFSLNYCVTCPEISTLVVQFCQPTNPDFCQFMLDCSVMPEVILATQVHGKWILEHLFHLSRTWVYNLHRARMKLLGRWNLF